MSSLHIAMAEHNLSKVARLIKRRKSLIGVDTILFAARYSTPAIFSCLMRANADINASHSDMRTPLHIAVEYNTPEMCSRLISFGANVNAQSSAGCTPLSVAATSKASMRTVILLLNSGASISTSDNDGWTPLHCAIASRHDDMALVLIDRGADINAKDFSGASPSTMIHLFNSKYPLE
jgi:ankyrin repeat protein